MFSAVYLVCFIGEPCQFFVDSYPYDTEEKCEVEAEANISRNMNQILSSGRELPSVDFQCIGWEKA